MICVCFESLTDFLTIYFWRVSIAVITPTDSFSGLNLKETLSPTTTGLVLLIPFNLNLPFILQS